MFFDNWYDLLRVAVVGTLGYCMLIFLLRVSGKRTLSKWNAFDFIVTVALGSTLATLLLSSEVTYVEGVFGLGMLIGLQFVIAWLSVRSRGFRRLTKAEPMTLYGSTGFKYEVLKHQRVTESEVRAAVRGAGVGTMQDVASVVLETDGSVSVIKKSALGDGSALTDAQ